MRKLPLTVIASCAVLAFVPSTALAKRQHHRSHVHHARLHHKQFGTDPSPTTTTPTSSPTAGTVQSFTGGVLTILLNDGSTVSGAVTSDTNIECQAPETTGMGDEGSQGGDSADQNQTGTTVQSDDDHGDDDGGGQTCDTSALTPQAVVQEAELTISGAGAAWSKVELAMSTSTSTPTSSPGDD